MAAPSRVLELLLRTLLLVLLAVFIVEALTRLADVDVPWPYPAAIAALIWLAMLRGYLAQRRADPDPQ